MRSIQCWILKNAIIEHDQTEDHFIKSTRFKTKNTKRNTRANQPQTLDRTNRHLRRRTHRRIWSTWSNTRRRQPSYSPIKTNGRPNNRKKHSMKFTILAINDDQTGKRNDHQAASTPRHTQKHSFSLFLLYYITSNITLHVEPCDSIVNSYENFI